MTHASSLHWSDWSAEEWNRQLILFCFVRDADAAPDQGLRASEDDLPDLTHDSDGASGEMAKALALAIQKQAKDRESSPARLLYEHVNRYIPTPQGMPPYFAFLWVTCLIAHGYPDPQSSGMFHARYEKVFGRNEVGVLGALPDAWQKLSEWLALPSILGGAPHRLLRLPPTDSGRANISHSWKLSFPRLADRRLLREILQHDRTQGYSLSSSSLSLVDRLQSHQAFSLDFREEVKRHGRQLLKNPDSDTWFGYFLQREIELLDGKPGLSQSASSHSFGSNEFQAFGPLLLRSYGYAMGVLLLAEGVPRNERNGFREVSGQAYQLAGSSILIPAEPEDPDFAAFDAGSLAIDPLQSPLPSLRPFLEKGMLPFRTDPLVGALRLINTEAMMKASHVLVRQDLGDRFLMQFSGRQLDCEEDGWICVNDFDATPQQLHRFPNAVLGDAEKELQPKLIPTAGLRVQEGYLATGLGLPSVRVRSSIPPQAVLLLSPEGRSLDYAAEDHDQEIWSPKQGGRRIIGLASGEARFVSFFEGAPTVERRLRLDRVPAQPRFKRGEPIAYREDWGFLLAPIFTLPSSEELAPQRPSESALTAARRLMNEGQGADPGFEQQMLDALCAVFQRRQWIRPYEFLQLYRQLGGMSQERPLFLEDLLRAWCEGGWLEQGMDRRRGLQIVQAIDPRLVLLADGRVQAVGLLSAMGMVELIAHAKDLGMAILGVPPACARLPRGWRFDGNAAALASRSGLALIHQKDWVESPLDWDWDVKHEECDGPEWPRSAQDPLRREERIRGTRGSGHLDYSRSPDDLFPAMDRAPLATVIEQHLGPYGRCRWHSSDEHGPFLSCHRNRVALHALHAASDGLWPFGFPRNRVSVIERFYDAEAYLPLPIGRYAALTGEQMPGPTLPPEMERHTYAYWLDTSTGSALKRERRIALIRT